MSEQPNQEPEQNLNISDSVLESVQIGGIAGRDLTQIQGEIGVVNVYGTVQVPQAPLEAAQPLSRDEYRWRQVLLSKVQQFWIDGILAKSLHTQVLIELGLEKRSDCVHSPLEGVEEFSSETKQVFTAGTSATDVFEDIGAGRTLLILGEPGSGKTVTLLKLTESLIARTTEDLSQPLPVVVNLSSWARQRKPIEDWLVQELAETGFTINKPLGKAWVEEEQLILLLDGLDEVEAKYRNACVQALNKFIQTHGRTEMVVCSRIRDYEALANKLSLRSAIYVQPLTPQQINEYLEQGGESLVALGSIINQNSEIKKFASSPLILSIMSLAYKDYSVYEINREGINIQFPEKLFNTYIERMFEGARKASYIKKIPDITKKYSKDNSQYWLTYLAYRMSEESQSIFFIERMQPYWLNPKHRILYYSSTWLLTIFIFSSFYFLIASLIILIDPELLIRAHTESITLLNLESSVSPSVESLSNQYSFWVGVYLNTLFIGLIAGLIIGFQKKIKTVETLKWSWKSGFESSIFGFFSGIKIGLILGPIIGITSLLLIVINDSNFLKLIKYPILRYLYAISAGGLYGIFIGFLIGFYIGIIFALFCIVFLGFRGPEILEKSKSIPNQGIWETAKNSLIYGLILSLAFSLLNVLSTGLYNYSNLYSGLSYAFLGIWIGGGAACLQHFILRFILYRMGHIPWNYARFLDYAAEHLFLQKVGGGYIFIHRMLLEHFASMELEPLQKNNLNS